MTGAVKCFKKGNKADQEFARTLAKRAHNIKTNKKRYAAAKVLEVVEAKSNAATRKRVREQFESINEGEETLRLVSMWQQVYSIDVEYPKSHNCHHVSFGSQIDICI